MLLKLLIYVLAGVALYRLFWAPAKEGLEKGGKGSKKPAEQHIKKPPAQKAEEAREEFTNREGEFIDYEEVD